MEQIKVTRDKGGRPDSATALRLHGAILAAAERTFLAEGYGSATVEAIATAAGTSKQTIYARFGSKGDLFLAVSGRLLGPRFPAKLPQDLCLQDKLAAAARQILDAMLDPKMVRMFTIITAEAHRFPELARATDDDQSFPGRLMIMHILQQAADQGDIQCDDLRAAMLMFQDMVLATPLRSAALGLDKFDAEALRMWADSAACLFLNGIRHR